MKVEKIQNIVPNWFSKNIRISLFKELMIHYNINCENILLKITFWKGEVYRTKDLLAMYIILKNIRYKYYFMKMYYLPNKEKFFEDDLMKKLLALDIVKINIEKHPYHKDRIRKYLSLGCNWKPFEKNIQASLNNEEIVFLIDIMEQEKEKRQ